MTGGEGKRHGEVFLAYARVDAGFARGVLATALEQAGVTVRDSSDFPLGRDYLDELDRAVRECDHTLIVVSPAYETDRLSQFTTHVFQRMAIDDAERRVIPIVYQEPTRDNPLLDVLSGIDWTDSKYWPDQLQQLCRQIGADRPEPPKRPPCPYPGIRPFRPADHESFCGRDHAVDEISARLDVQDRLLLIGPSGSGKSSLALAGVIPRLTRPGGFRGHAWAYKELRPGTNPLDVLAQALESSKDLLHSAASRRLATSGADRFVLVVDQLEELFTVADDGQHEFIAALSAVSKTDGCRVLATMRADFYPDLMQNLPLWREFSDHRFDVVPLTRDELAEAIRQPARRVGVHLEGSLVDKLLDDASSEPGMMPFVQQTLVDLWDRSQYLFVPLSAYVVPRQAYGEPPRTTLQRALENLAGATIAGLDPADRGIVPSIFLRLVQLGEGRQDVRRQRTMDQLKEIAADGAAVRRTIDAFVAAHLLTTNTLPGDDSVVTVDLAHEALITGWSELRTWIDELRSAEKVRQRLEDKASAWTGRGETGGLLDDIELKEAESWSHTIQAQILSIDVPITRLIRASSEAQRERLRQQEAARTAREKLLRTTRYLLVGVSVLLVVAIAAAVYAYQRQQAAADAAAKTNAVEIGVVANQLADQSIDRALLLGIEAQRIRPVPEAEAALVSTLARTPALDRILQAHDAPVNAVAATQDGSMIVSAGDDGLIVRWNADGTVRRTIDAQAGPIHALALSSDGKVLVSGHDDGTLRRWDPQTGAPIGNSTAGHRGSVRGLAIDPTNAWFASAGDDGTVRTWDAATGALRQELDGHTGVVYDVAISSDGSLLASGDADGQLMVRDTRDFSTVRTLSYGQAIRGLAFGPAGSPILGLALQDGRVAVANTDEPDRTTFLTGHPERVFDVAFSADGHRIASAGRDQTILIHDVMTGRLVTTLNGHSGDIRGIAYLPGDRLVSASRDQTLMLWNPDRAPRLAQRPLGPESSIDVAFSPDGDRLLSIIGTPEIRDLDVTAGTSTSRPLPTTPTTVTFSPDGSRVAVGSVDGSLTVLDASSMSTTTAPPTPATGSPTKRVAFDPGGGIIATGDRAGAVTLFDSSSGRQLAQRQLASYAVTDLAFDGSGNHLLITDENGTMWSWSTGESDAQLRQVIDNRARSGALAFTADGKELVVGTAQDQVVIWNVVDGQPTEIITKLDHFGPIDDLTVDDGGRIVAADAESGTVSMWNASGRPLGVLPIPSARAVAVRRDTRTLAVAGAAGTQVWDLSTDNLIATACGVANRDLTEQEWSFYIGGEYRSTCPPASGPGPGPGR